MQQGLVAGSQALVPGIYLSKDYLPFSTATWLHLDFLSHGHKGTKNIHLKLLSQEQREEATPFYPHLRSWLSSQFSEESCNVCEGYG